MRRCHASGWLRAAARGRIRSADACRGAEVVITMLPAGEQVRDVYLGDGACLRRSLPGTLLIDSSTIDVETAREVAQAAEGKGICHGRCAGVRAASPGPQAATLTFMVGGSDDAFERARPVLENMGKTIVHAGGPGTGQAAKICNNMILGRIDDRGFRSLPAGGEARASTRKAVRHLVEVLGPMLVDDKLLSGAGTGADLAGEPRLSGRLHRGDDAQGFETGASCRARDPRHHAARCRRRRGLRALRRERATAASIFPASFVICAGLENSARPARIRRSAA